MARTIFRPRRTPTPGFDPGIPPACSSGWRRRRRAEAYLPQLERKLAQAGLDVETAVVVSARPEADAIVAYATEHGCDLIAMPSDPRPWYARWLGRSQNGANRWPIS